jgi:hypothetical protein
MNHTPDYARNRFDLESIDRWSPHPDRGERKFGKVQLSVRRQRIEGAGIEEVRTKLLRLHRMSKGFDGNGSTSRLKQAIGLEPMPVEFTPAARIHADHYQSHPTVLTDLPTTEQARNEMRLLKQERIEEARPSSEDHMADAEDRFDILEGELQRVYQRIRLL